MISEAIIAAGLISICANRVSSAPTFRELTVEDKMTNAYVKWQVTRDSGNASNFINDGMHGRVYAIDYGGVERALKCYYQADPQAASACKREVNILRDIQNHGVPNVMRIYDVIDLDNDRTCYVIDLAQHGDLFDLGVSARAMLQPPQLEVLARHWARRAALAMSKMHKIDLAYIDMKLENLLLDERFETVLSDFGLSGYLTELEDGKIRSGTYTSLPQETVEDWTYVADSDWFELGIALFKFVAGTNPFVDEADEGGEYENASYRHNLMAGNVKPFPKGYSEDFKKFVFGCLAPLGLRWTDEKIVKHPWLAHFEPEADAIAAKQIWERILAKPNRRPILPDKDRYLVKLIPKIESELAARKSAKSQMPRNGPANSNDVPTPPRNSVVDGPPGRARTDENRRPPAAGPTPQIRQKQAF